MKSRIQEDENDDEQVSQHGQQINGEEKSEQQALGLHVLRKAQEDKLGHEAVVFLSH